MINLCTYKDQEAIKLSSNAASFTFLPKFGASMVSAMLGKKEFMIQRPEPYYRTVPFDGNYEEGECAGMDDTFPTIDTCYYQSFPWNGTKLADHGEIWNTPLAYTVKDDCVEFSASGVRLPYVFYKKISMIGVTTLRIDYRVTNPTNFPMDFLWSAHTMLRAEPGLKLIVPDDCAKAQTVFHRMGTIGEYADTFEYPVHLDKNGVPQDLSVMTEPRDEKKKFFFKHPQTQGFCAIEHTDGSRFEMRYPPEQVPYLGIVQNYGNLLGIYNIFLEPSTSSFDRPDIAKVMGKCSVIPANSDYTWYLEIALS